MKLFFIYIILKGLFYNLNIGFYLFNNALTNLKIIYLFFIIKKNTVSFLKNIITSLIKINVTNKTKKLSLFIYERLFSVGLVFPSFTQRTLFPSDQRPFFQALEAFNKNSPSPSCFPFFQYPLYFLPSLLKDFLIIYK